MEAFLGAKRERGVDRICAVGVTPRCLVLTSAQKKGCRPTSGWLNKFAAKPEVSAAAWKKLSLDFKVQLIMGPAESIHGG